MTTHNTSAEPTLSQRMVPMQVLALGFSRTGTSCAGLRAHEPRGGRGAGEPATMDMWAAALRAKFHREGAPFGRAEWDRLLGDCQAVTDAPHILFAAELIAACPDAKVVLTTRDVDSWWKSYEATVTEAITPASQVRAPRTPRRSTSSCSSPPPFLTQNPTEEIAKALRGALRGGAALDAEGAAARVRDEGELGAVGCVSGQGGTDDAVPARQRHDAVQRARRRTHPSFVVAHVAPRERGLADHAPRSLVNKHAGDAVNDTARRRARQDHDIDARHAGTRRRAMNPFSESMGF
ncbi:hypothetical protein DFH09DRAFT_1273042 [Mycena vulgaris]|nr:hypothetical protein DFH09DRAFT_1273042 [Mycena vulgaris]